MPRYTADPNVIEKYVASIEAELKKPDQSGPPQLSVATDAIDPVIIEEEAYPDRLGVTVVWNGWGASPPSNAAERFWRPTSARSLPSSRSESGW